MCRVVKVEASGAVSEVRITELGRRIEGIASRADIVSLCLAKVPHTVVDKSCWAADTFVCDRIIEKSSWTHLALLAFLSQSIESKTRWTSDDLALFCNLIVPVSLSTVHSAT